MLKRWTIVFRCQTGATHAHDCGRQQLRTMRTFWTRTGAIAEAAKRNLALTPRASENYVWKAVPRERT